MRTILMTMIVAAFASPALADFKEPPPDGAWLPPVIAVLLAILVVGSNMKNAKRGHQD